jgi:hypothetical protein
MNQGNDVDVKQSADDDGRSWYSGEYGFSSYNEMSFERVPDISED